MLPQTPLDFMLRGFLSRGVDGDREPIGFELIEGYFVKVMRLRQMTLVFELHPRALLQAWLCYEYAISILQPNIAYDSKGRI